MKLRHLFYAAAALLPLAIACNKQENPEDQAPSIKATPSTVQFEAAAGSKTVDIEATRDWTVASKPEWVEVTPSSGKASMSAQTVTLTVLSNSGNDHEGSIVFSSGLVKTSVKVSQKGEAGELLPGSGTKEDPYTVMGVLAYLNTLGNNVESPEVVYVKGIVSNVVQDYTYNVTETDFGNARFYMKDAATDEKDFYCYNIMYLGNKKFEKGQTDVKVGDNVIICGKVVNYSGTSGKVTPETVNKTSYLYSLNGTVVEPQVQTEITESTVADFIAKNDGLYYRLTGTVSAFQTGHNANGNYDYMQFNLTDATGTVIVYGFKDRDASYKEWSTKIKDGGTVVLTGTYEKYTDKNGNVKDEVMNATIESFKEGAEQTDFEDVTVSEFIQKADGVTAYRLTGVVTGFYTGKDKSGNDYMGFDLTDATGTVTVYGFKDKAGSFAEWSTKIKDGGTVKPHGTYQKYTNSDGSIKHEVMNTVIEEFTEGAEQTEFEEITVAEFIQKADKVTYYDLKGTVSEFESHVDAKDNETYMSFTLTDASGSIYVYGFADGEVAAWKDKIVDGGNITVRGIYSYYEKETKHEVVKAKILNFEADPNYKYCQVSGEKAINVKADATEAEIKIKANAAWTLTASEGATLSAAYGEADATVKVTFAANESTEAEKVYTLTLKCEAASVNETITITQAKAAAAGAGEYELDLSTATYKSASANQVVWETDFFTITVDKDGASTDANNYLGGGKNSQGNTITSSRFYSKSKVTITPAAGKTLTSLVWTATTTNYATAFGNSTWTNASAAASGTTVTVTPTNGAANISAAIGGTCGFTKVVVSYE